jgi:hypothetical protein
MRRFSDNHNSREKGANPLIGRFRCSPDFGDFEVCDRLSPEPGYFRFGADAVCYGRCGGGCPAQSLKENLPDVIGDVVVSGSGVRLPFDPTQVVDNLLHERYCATPAEPSVSTRALRNLYYAVRPVLGVSVRRLFQRMYFRGWDKIPFPNWPVDATVENILSRLLVFSMKSKSVTRIPFIWYWPDGWPSCTMMTHDVETSAGLDFCPQLMDLNDSFGIKSAFQIVPEKRYTVQPSGIETIRERGFEINVHDLNHDGHLLNDRHEFLRRVQQINAYGRQFGAQGFRAAVMYRNSDWFEALDFAYDMSVPNVAHLEPQRGGCCTVFPFFLGNMVELPLTTTQDYSLFNILNDYSIRIWQMQIACIRKNNGLISFIVHPDYMRDASARSVYAELLEHLCVLRSNRQTWIALPNEIAAWWRLRSQLSLVEANGQWRIVGEGSDRARLAYAAIDNDRLTYELEVPVETRNAVA